LDAARRFSRDEAKPWLSSGVAASVDDSSVQHRYGELALALRAARPLADEAAALLSDAWKRGAALEAEERGDVAIAVERPKPRRIVCRPT
jgi:alkylation response protein AidB-like acyl-CoA dehydrogenase